MMDTNLDHKGGALPDGTGSRASTEPLSGVSAVPASIPSAWRCIHCGHGEHKPCVNGLTGSIDERLVLCARCFALHSAPHINAQMAKGFAAAVSAVRAWADGFYNTHTAGILRLLASDLERNQDAILSAASGIAARSDETPQEVRPAGQEPGPQGDANPQGGSSKGPNNAE